MTATYPMGLTPAEQIDFFFAPPLPPQPGPHKSLLHLNRQEAQDCLIGFVVPEPEVLTHKPHRLFATTMVIAAGIDLLGKFYVGSDRGKVEDRITGFAERFVFTGQPSAATFAKVMYFGCRNPMLHSFSLQNDRYEMRLTDQLASGAIWRATAPDGSVSYLVSVPGLYTAYVAAIERYHAALLTDTTLQRNFSKMFADYGFIGVFDQLAQPIAREASRS